MYTCWSALDLSEVLNCHLSQNIFTVSYLRFTVLTKHLLRPEKSVTELYVYEIPSDSRWAYTVPANTMKSYVKCFMYKGVINYSVLHNCMGTYNTILWRSESYVNCFVTLWPIIRTGPSTGNHPFNRKSSLRSTIGACMLLYFVSIEQAILQVWVLHGHAHQNHAFPF